MYVVDDDAVVSLRDNNNNQVLKSDDRLFKYATKFSDESINWRHKGAVSPIKDQGQTSTSWAFSAVETL